MSAFKQKAKKIGVRAGLLAGVSAAVLAVGGASASSALATPTCTTGSGKTAIEGKGSSLQRLAQEAWTGRFVPSGEPLLAVPHEIKTGGYAATCGEEPSVSYTSTSSGNGLTAFRYTGEGVIQNGAHEGEAHSMAFIGTDDGPTPAQIEHGEAATEGGVLTGAKGIIVPVAETAIGVLVHPPSGCTLTSSKTSGITYAQLNKIFNGTAEWSELSHTGTCEGKIRRVVRKDASGTSFQFKNYLSELETTTGILAAGPGCGLGTWAALRQIENAETGAPNTTWPECEGTSEVVKKEGGGGVAGYVASAEGAGSIGYAALPDAKSKGATVARLQNLISTTAPTYALPENGTTSNCGARVYTVPTNGQEEAGETKGVGVNWNAVYGASPNVGSTLYPLCTLTYDVAWGLAEGQTGSGYGKAGYKTPETVAMNVKAYLNYVVTEATAPEYYQALPQPGTAEHDVKGAAEQALKHVK